MVITDFRTIMWFIPQSRIADSGPGFFMSIYVYNTGGAHFNPVKWGQFREILSLSNINANQKRHLRPIIIYFNQHVKSL